MKLLAAEIFLLLISLLISKGFVYGEQGCTEKFMELSQVTYRAQHTSTTATGMISSDKIRALQEYQFNCSSTNITSLILGIDVRRATGSINLFPSVRVYTPSNDPGKYDLVTGSERTIYYSPSNVSTSGVFEYPLNPPIPVMTGEVVAIVQPLEEESVVRVYYTEDVSGISFSSSSEISISPDQIDLGSSPITNQLILVYPVTDGYCVNSANSITPSVIRNNFLTIQSSGDIDQRRQYLYPEIVFSCNGSLTKWIYGGEPVSGNNRNDLPELQIWRQLGPNNYNKIGSSLVNANTMIGTNLYEFIPQTPLQFQEGDIFGVHSPQSTQRLFDLYEQVRNGPLNERVGGNVADPSSTITQALVTDTNNDFPLVTVEVSISVASSVTSSTSTSPVISTTFVMITSTALTAATISTTDNTILSSTVVSITLSSTSSVLVTATPSSSVTTDTPPSISSSISRSDDFNSLLLSLTYSSSSFDTTLVTSSTVIITTAPSDSSVIATTATSTAPSSTSVMTNTHSSSSSMTDTTSTSVATSAFSSTSMMTNTPSSSLSMTDTTPTSVTTSAPSSTSMMTNTPSSSLSMTDTTPTSVTTSAPSSTSLMTSTPPNSSSATIPPNTVSATSTGSTASSSSSVITGATTPSSSSTDSITSSSHAVTSSPTASPSVISNPSAGSGASTVIAVVISILVLFIATSVGIIIVLLLVMKKRKKRYTDRVTLLTASFSASSTLRSEGGYTINNVVYDDVDKLSGPVTYDHYETAPDVPQRGSTVSNPLYSDTNMQQKTSTISNPLYGDKSFEAAAVETAYETLITDKKSSPVDDIKVEGHLPDDQINIYDELNNQSALPSAKSNEEPHYWAPGDDTSSIYQQMESKGYKQLKGNDIKISNELGSGEFGTVYEGTWFSKPVAIKTLKNSSEEQDKVKFLQEAAIMGQFHHPNIVKLHGMVTVGEPLMIVLELIPHGDMRQYLHTLQPQPGELVASTVPGILLSFCRQIASGMEYLSKKGFVHRDLAARNILIADHGMCKIADFGMSRDLHDENYYVSTAKMIPVKWTSPEALKFKRYSSASDIWSYGAVMYEMWSLGHKPFENFSNQEYVKLIDTGYRLPPPPGCPRPVYKIMIQCWHPKTSGRPTFADIVPRFGSSDIKKLNEVVEREGTVLGGPLESAYDLYTDLQNTYTIN